MLKCTNFLSFLSRLCIIFNPIKSLLSRIQRLNLWITRLKVKLGQNWPNLGIIWVSSVSLFSNKGPQTRLACLHQRFETLCEYLKKQAIGDRLLEAPPSASWSDSMIRLASSGSGRFLSFPGLCSRLIFDLISSAISLLLSKEPTPAASMETLPFSAFLTICPSISINSDNFSPSSTSSGWWCPLQIGWRLLESTMLSVVCWRT